MINNEDVRPTANLVISKCTAYEYLNNSKPNLEKLTTQYYETFSITGRFTGYFSNITIGDFYNDLSSNCSQPTAILGGLNSTARKEDSQNSTKNSSQSSESSQTSNSTGSDKISESPNAVTNPEELTAGTSSIVGKRGTENFGIAVFKEDQFRGELTAVEALCHLLIQNRVDSCIVSIDNPVSEKEAEKMELQIFPRQNSNINITIENDTPHISINLKLHADIMSLDKDIEYDTEEVLSKISSATKDYLSKQINDYLKKVATEYESDIDNFGIKATAHFLTINEWDSFNWNEKFKDATFNVNVDVNVLSTMLVTKT